jgi:hypothetical protein
MHTHGLLRTRAEAAATQGCLLRGGEGGGRHHLCHPQQQELHVLLTSLAQQQKLFKEALHLWRWGKGGGGTSMGRLCHVGAGVGTSFTAPLKNSWKLSNPNQQNASLAHQITSGCMC